ncbi:cell division ATP-binding protein FtsE [Amaricoccus tamworthensis]|uniref:cell division ATP-binding protein FtsE n=1 Tax=Amaricoccus tamworthensis TaxID=57002 RepID=UPI003C7ABE11
MIQLEDAGFRYGQTGFLRKLNLSIGNGGFCIVLGPSGAGKTTLVRLCIGELDPVLGHVLHDGRIVTRADRRGVADLRRRYGILAQDCRFLDHLNARDNVALALRAAGVDPAGRRQDLDALFEWIGLGGRQEAMPPEMSVSERKHLALARAVIRDPEMIVADDPCNGLDDASAWSLLGLLVELNRMGKAVLMTTQDHQFAREAAKLVPVERLLLTGDGFRPAEDDA